VGAFIGERYEISKVLGHGGMGTVYQVIDHELDRVAALKVIRPEWASDPEIIRRFKQELLLARRISHPSVIQIYDISNEGGLWFISMAYVEGRDLAHVIEERGKLPPAEAASIIAKVAEGLQAAHLEGVVHRDLKPPNIMVRGDSDLQVKVMDFGIARSVDGSGMTRAGTVLGTPDYMSPEQAKGENVDIRSDLFSLGIIFYELLTGVLPFRAETMMGTLLKRCQENAIPPRQLDTSIPQALNDIVMKALTRDRNSRYQTAQEFIADLDKWTHPQPSGALRLWVRNVLLVLIVLASAANVVVWYRNRSRGAAPAPQKSASLLVSDFENTTGEAVFEGTLESMFVVGLEGAPFITCYDRGSAHVLAAQLRPGTVRLDPSLAQLLATREGINGVVAGTVARDGDGYNLSVRAIDAATGKEIATRSSGRISKERVLAAVAELVTPVRAGLGDKFSASRQRYAGETFTSRSLDAIHSYALAQELQWNGKFELAARQYARAIQLDPEFGRAYAGLAAMNANFGKRAEAEKYYQAALKRTGQMTDREKYRTRGGYYLLIRDDQMAIEEFSALVKEFPADTAGLANLSFVYLYRRDFARALAQGREASAIYPKNVVRRNNLALYLMYSGDFDGSMAEANRVLQMNPSYEKAYVAIALSQLATGQREKASETWQRLAGVSKLGATLSADGLADLALYQGLHSVAIPQTQKAIVEDEANQNVEQAGVKRLMLAEVQLERGMISDAVALADKVVATNPPEGGLYTAARIYLRAHRPDRALKLAGILAGRIGPEARSYGRLVEGELALQNGKFADAVSTFGAAQALSDTWLAHYFLASAYLENKSFEEALKELDICLKRRGEATSIFLDEIPTLRYLPQIHYLKGRAEEALKSPNAAQSYKAYLAIRGTAERDSWLADARRGAGVVPR
jgi:tetratricopeptide (TPR) repeat protein